MKITKQITLITCMLLITAFSYAMSAKKEGTTGLTDSTNLPPLIKGPIGGSLPKSCIHQSSRWIFQKNGPGYRVYGPAYAYAIVHGMDPCPKFSSEFEDSSNVINESELQDVEWGANSLPTSDASLHGHCDVINSQITKECIDGNCVLPDGCTNYDNPTKAPSNLSSSASNTASSVLNNINPGSTRDLTPIDHCNVGNGDPY